MKLKAKFGTLFFALALAGGTLIGCNNGGDNPSAVTTKYYVNLPAASQDYTIAGIDANGYEKGATVSFTVTLANPNDKELGAVKYDDNMLTAGTDGKFTFVMPEKDVRLSVTVKDIKKYALSYEGSLKRGMSATFSLTFGTDPVPGSQYILEPATDSALVEINEKVVTFKEVGNVVIVAKKDGAEVARTATLNIVEPKHGELITDPMTGKEAADYAHTLDISYNEKVDGKTVWTYNQSEEFFYITGVVSKWEGDGVSEANKNASFWIDDLFQVYRVRTAEEEDLTKIDIGSKVMVHTKIMNFGGKTTTKNKGTPETYSASPDFASITSVDNTAPYSIDFDQAVVVAKPNDDVTVNATIRPSTATPAFEATWTSADPTVATVTNGKIHAVAEGETTVTAKVGTTTVERSIKVIVSNTKLKFRQALKNELEVGKDFYLRMESGKTEGKALYATGDMNGYYLNTNESLGEAAVAKLALDANPNGDYKYNITLNGKPILAYTTHGEKASDCHYNIGIGESMTSENIGKFKINDDLQLVASLPDKDPTSNAVVDVILGTTTYETISLNIAEEIKKTATLYGYLADLAPTAIALNKTTASIAAGEGEQLVVTPTPDSASLDELEWSSSKTDVATVKDGLVTAVATGTTTITAKCGDATATCEVTVTAADTRWNTTLENVKQINELTLEEGEDKAVKAKVIGKIVEVTNTTFGNATLVSKDGKYTFTAYGMYYLGGTVRYDGLTYKPVAGDVVILEGDTFIFVDSKAGTKTPEIKNGQLLQVNGTVSAIPTLTGFELNKTSIKIDKDEKYTLTIKPLPYEAVLGEVTWSVSEGSDYVEVNNGVVTGKAYGSATVKVTSNANAEVFATCSVTVTDEVDDFEITYAVATSNGLTTTAGKQTITYKGTTITISNGVANATNSDMRAYKNATMKFESTRDIKKIVLETKASDVNGNGLGKFGTGVPEGWSYTAGETTGTWTGSAKEITFTAVDAQVRLISIKVYYVA